MIKVNTTGNSKKARNRATSGFTLAEVLIAIAIVIILLAVGIIAGTRLIRNTRQSHLDKRAEAVYYAAQSRMMELFVTQEKVEEEIQQGGKTITVSVVDELFNGNTFSYDGRDMAYITSNDADSIVFKDHSLSEVGGAYAVIEYDPVSLDVYAVILCDNPSKAGIDIGGLTQQGSGSPVRGTAQDRIGAYKGYVGYYSEGLNPKLGAKVDSGLSAGAWIVNGRDLLGIVKITVDEETKDLLDNLTFKLTVRGPKTASGSSETYAEIDISSCKIVWQNYQGAPENNYLDMEGTASGSGQRKISTSGSLDTSWFGEVTDSGEEYGLIGYIKLDSLDKDYHLSDLLDAGVDTDESTGSIKPGEDISLSFKVWDSATSEGEGISENVRSASAVSNIENSLFGDFDYMNGQSVAEIIYPRHLQNLDYEYAEATAEAADKAPDGAGKIAAVLAEDIDWAETLNLYNGEVRNFTPISNEELTSFTGKCVELDTSSTTPIIEQLSPVVISSADDITVQNPEAVYNDPNSTDKYHVIENIRIDTTDTTYVGTDRNVGLFGDQSDITVANLVLRSFDLNNTSNMPTGMLAGKLSGDCAVKNVFVYNKTEDAISKAVKGTACVGGVIGEAVDCEVDGVVIKNICVNSTGGDAGALMGKGAGDIKNVLAYNGADTPEGGDPAATTLDFNDSEYEITGAQNVGGLVGQMTGGTVDGCGAALYVRSTGGNAGGLIGTSAAAVTKSYSGGHTITEDEKAGIYSDETAGQGRINVQGVNAGGLVGGSTGSIESSYSTCSAAGSANTGGLVGSASGSISNCYAVGRVLMGSNPGAIAGSASSISNSYYISLINESYDTAADEFVYLCGVGGATEDAAGSAIAVDVDEENGAEGVDKYNQFMADASEMANEAERVAAPYDHLFTTYGMKTNNDLAGSGSGTDEYFFTKSHYGDWPIPEHIIFNNASSASIKKRNNNNFFVINAMAASEDGQKVEETSSDATVQEVKQTEETSAEVKETSTEEPKEQATSESQESESSNAQEAESTEQKESEAVEEAPKEEATESKESEGAQESSDNKESEKTEEGSKEETSKSQEGAATESKEGASSEEANKENNDASTEGSSEEAASTESSSAADSSNESPSEGASTEQDATAETTTQENTDTTEEASQNIDDALDKAVRKAIEKELIKEGLQEEAEEEQDVAGEIYSAEELVKLIYGEAAEIPEGAEVQVVEITPEDDKYEGYVNGATDALEIEGEEVASVKVLDIKIIKDGEEIQPKAAVSVEVNTEQLYENNEVFSDDEILTVHFKEENNEAEVLDTEVKVNEEEEESDEAAEENTAVIEAADAVSFETDSFSVYVFVQPVKEKEVIASDGSVYEISATYDNASGIPAGAELVVDEIEKGSDGYEQYVEEGKECLGIGDRLLTYARAFDISFADQETGDRYQPTKDVNVSIRLLQDDLSQDEDNSLISVAHFGEETEAVGFTLEDGAVNFTTSGFSVYLVAQTVKEKIVECSDGSSYKVTVTYDGRAGIPGDAELSVREITEGDDYNNYVQISADIQNKDIDSFVFARPFDIKLINPETGNAYQPQEGVKVSMELIGTELRDDADLCVVHIPDDMGNANIMNFDVNEGSIDFETDGFSVFVYTESTFLRTYRFFTYVSSSDPRYVEYSIWTDSGSTTFTQKIKNNTEELVVPRLPSLEGSTTTTFSGWFVGSNVTSETIEGATYFTPESLADTEFDFNNIPEVTQTETIYVFAKFADYAYVIFHDQYNGSSQSFPVAQTRRGEKINGVATVNISDVSVAYDDDSQGGENSAPSYAFYGWSYTPITIPGALVDDNGDPVSKIDTDSINITGKTYLYPIFRSIFWLSYDAGPTGSGATYVPSKYYYSGEGPTSLTVPVRSGYTFEGWYADATADADGIVTSGVRISDANGVPINGATGTTVSVSGGKLVLSSSTKLTANWTVSPVQYSIVIWRQKATDQPDLADDAKTYDYAESITKYERTGVSVGVGTEYKNLSTGDYKGFHFDRCDDNKLVNSNGSTVLNVYYDRNVHTFRFRANNSTTTSSNANSPTVHTVSALYGADINNIWSFRGSNNINYPITGSNNTTSWYPINSSSFSGRLTRIAIMPDEDIQFYHYISNNTKRYFYYYVEALPGDTNIRTFDGRQFSLYTDLTNDFNRIIYDVDFWELEGYTRYKIGTQNGGDVTSTIINGGTSGASWNNGWNNTLYFYYLRNEYNIDFYDSYTNSYAYVNGAQLGSVDIKYGYSTKDYVPADPSPVEMLGANNFIPREGCTFKGWFADKACSTRVFFEDNDEYRNYTESKVLYDTMPTENIKVYAGWEEEYYLIQIDPNYGQLSPEESTWFWEKYNGDLIQEYTDVTRDYVESSSGTSYYVNRNRAYYGLTDEWTPAESGLNRRANYTTSLDDVKDFTRYKYVQNAYRYAGWYEVDEQGNETLYNFNNPITHNLKLVLHWKRIGTYYVQYNPVVEQNGVSLAGTLDSGDSNEPVFAELDGDDYADNAEVVVTRTAKAPEGYNFVGWKVRGDDSGTIYHPGEAFIMKAKYTVSVGGKDIIYLDAVYTRIGTAKIIYDANCGAIDASVVDLGEPTEENAPTPSRIVDENGKSATIGQLVNNSAIRLSNGTGFVLGSAELMGWNTAPDCSGDHFDLNGNYYVDTEEPITLYAEWRVKVYFDKNWPDAGWGGEWNDTDTLGNPIFTYDSDLGRYYTYVYINRTVPMPSCIPTSPDPEKMFYYWSRERYTEHPAQYVFSTPVTDGDVILYAHWDKVKNIPVHAVDTSEPTFVRKDDDWLINGRSTVVDVSNEDVMLATAADISPYVTSIGSDYEFAFTCVSDSVENCDEANAISKVWYNIDAACVYVTYQNGSSGELDSDDEIYFVYFKNPKTVDIGYVWMDTNRTVSSIEVNQNAPLTATVGNYSVNENITAPLSYQTTTNYGYYAYAIGSIGATSDADLKLITQASGIDTDRPSLTTKNGWNGFRYSINGNTWTNVGYEMKLYVVYFESMPSVLTLKEKTVGTQNDMDEYFTYNITIVEYKTTVEQDQKKTRSKYRWEQNYSNNWSAYADVGMPRTNTTTNTTQRVIELKNAEKETISLFYAPSNESRVETSRTEETSYFTVTETVFETLTITKITQKIIITQEKKTDFDVDNEAFEGNSNEHVGKRVDERTYEYSTDPTDPAGSVNGTLSSPNVTFTNIRKKIKVEVHVAVIDADDQGNTTIYQRDEAMRTDGANTTENNSFEVEINYPTGDHTQYFKHEENGVVEGILHDLPPIATDDTSGILKTGFEGYGFAGVAYGSEDAEKKVELKWPRSTLAGITTLEKITYGKLYTNKDNIYDLYFNENTEFKVDDNFQDEEKLPVYRLYYVYYRVPKVVYVKESEGGVLTRVQGSLDGTTVVDNITYNGSEQTISSGLNKESNEGKVAQEQLLPVTNELFTISQSSTDFFNMLPLMDDGTNKLYLTYSMVGIGKTSDLTKITDLDGYVEVGNGPNYPPLYLKHEDNQLKWSKDDITWQNFIGEAPTIYAIYKEKGFELNISKVLKNCSSSGKEFKIRISSLAIMESSYEVEGTGAATIEATPISVDEQTGDTIPGTIDITIKSVGDLGTDGTNGNTISEEDIENAAVVIKGLAKGKYTISEILTEGSGSYELEAEAGDNWEDIWEVYGTENDSDKITRIKKDEIVKTNESEGRFLTLPELDFTEVTIVGEGENAVASKMVLLENTSDKTRRIILRKETQGTNKPVTGAVFDIHYSDGSLFEENCTSGSAGAYYVGDMPYGTFYIHEKSPSAGYYELKIYDKDDGSEYGVVELSTDAKASIEAWRD